MKSRTAVVPVVLEGKVLFTIELLDERPEGFSVCVPELGIYTFGTTEQQTLRRVHPHVADKYQDLINSPTPLNDNEEEYLRHYRTLIVPALIEASLRSPRPSASRHWKNLLRMVPIVPEVSAPV
ncbi:MAG: hypothetical protein AUJ92_02530 [Armatimonadetes bacterium CG2_30_59_28]|nr:hypothetical protein [Armatimonadota bacterium]OIO97961.1 MAG: hypothetical protein AUJ92_02530 [Armatimonadetes bacterium CG2_30_59_28]PIU63536.1 MAG: hypothetical protein COS85_15650 [Armatimonadetes bacterium CG07_land_8_20_14_0_80_59_28]PIX40546.1 MAG: hypothetical protein COZ56_14435 [Armatimonadetes bacterium CG_4_8_14_3_um_filter_58_9]PIY48502.1 MAG: hypothetical protein COZ05_02915 [Armatimonadetes bacterium CG_4_10_14_3_um_filter_59_10]